VTWLAVAAVITAAALPWRGAGASAPTATPDAAVRASLEAHGTTYAGDCDATASPRDLGKACSRLVEERGGVRAYLVGRTFSEFTTWLFVGEDGGRWSVVRETPLCFECESIEIPWP